MALQQQTPFSPGAAAADDCRRAKTLAGGASPRAGAKRWGQHRHVALQDQIFSKDLPLLRKLSPSSRRLWSRALRRPRRAGGDSGSGGVRHHALVMAAGGSGLPEPKNLLLGSMKDPGRWRSETASVL
ncbi:hypothetical protein T636_A1464 [Enterobacter hormaechei subsp. xiangfangensis]|nr:hypothetical protein T636_A1464 [Enterobacter hormaechei subsp. xiangfangensis]